jgi:hypothetical protein
MVFIKQFLSSQMAHLRLSFRDLIDSISDSGTRRVTASYPFTVFELVGGMTYMNL